jgi:hypothetical protein
MLRGLSPWLGSVSHQALYAPIVGGRALVKGEADAMGIDFTYDTDVTKQMRVTTSGTPVDSSPFSTLTYTSPSVKMTRQSDGVWRYVNHNFCLQSQTLGSWALSRVTVSADATTAPDGTSTADKVVEDGTAGQDHFAQSTSSAAGLVITGRTYTLSFFAKAAEHTWCQLTTSSGQFGTNVWANFQLSGAGTVGNAGSATSGASITSVGDGWYLCSLRGVATGSGTPGLIVCALTDDTDSASRLLAYNGDSASGVYFWGAQAKTYPANDALGYTYATGYIATTTAAKYDLPYEWDASGNPLGILIEEARTNLLVRSQEYGTTWVATNIAVSANATTAPDGTTTADRVTANAGSAVHDQYQTLTVTTNVDYAHSVFIKKDTHRYVFLSANTGNGHMIAAVFDLDGGGTTATQTAVGGSSGTITSTAMIDAGNGWYRCVLVGKTTGTSAGTDCGFVGAATGITFDAFGGSTYNAAGTEAVYKWGHQVELGSFATSPIHTIAATVTRAVDNITLPVSAFPWVASPGTLIGNAMINAHHSSAELCLVSVNNDDVSERVAVVAERNNADNKPRVVFTDGSAAQADFAPITSSAITLGAAFKVGAAWAVNDFAACYNGGTVDVDVAGSVGFSMLTMSFGRQGNNTAYLNGYIRQITYLARAVSDADLQTLTT